MEVGTFKRMDEGTDSTSYFMIVNRVCNTNTGDTANAQSANVVVGGGRYFIQDQRSNEIYLGSYNSGTNQTTFAIPLGRGEGKLFLLKPTREGTISSNTTWRNAEVITSTVTVNSGVTLTVQQGTTVKFQSSTSLTINGTLNAQASSGNPVTFDRVTTSGDWLGIKYQSGSSGTLDNVIIQHAKKGVYVASSSPTIQNCTIETFTEQGIYVIGGNSKIYTNTINGWSGSAQVGTGIYVDNSGLGSSTLEIASNNVIMGCYVGVDVTAPVYKLEHNTLGTSGTYSDLASNAYGINFTGVGTVTNNKVYGDNDNSTGISLQPNSGSKTTTYNLLDHHYIGLIDNGFQDGSITLNSFTNDQISFDNSDGWMTTQQNNFWDSGVTTYNILNFTQSDPDMTNNYLQSYSVSGNEKIYDANQFLRWYPPAGSAFSAGPLWKLSGPPDLRLPGATTTSESNITAFALSSYPNPFNPATTITFEVPQPTFVSLILYDMLGRQVKTLSESYRSKGTYSIVWDATDSRGALLSSGVYLLRMRAGNTVLTHKLLLTK
jgi:hypothetical protein